MTYEWASLRDEVPGWREPLSPAALIQEMVPSRWAAVVGAQLCCRTRRAQSHPLTWRLLALWPTPEELALAPVAEVAHAIKPAGLQTRRADHLVRMSRMWVAPGYRPSSGNLPGCGTYVCHSDLIFGMGRLDFDPDDRELLAYVLWARAEGVNPIV